MSKNQKILPCEQSCCFHALGTRKKLQNPHIRTILLLSRPWNTKKVTNPSMRTILLLSRPWNTKKFWCEKKIGAKKNSKFFIEVNDKKNFLDPSGDNPGFSHIDVIRKVKARLFSEK